MSEKKSKILALVAGFCILLLIFYYAAFFEKNSCGMAWFCVTPGLLLLLVGSFIWLFMCFYFLLPKATDVGTKIVRVAGILFISLVLAMPTMHLVSVIGRLPAGTVYQAHEQVTRKSFTILEPSPYTHLSLGVAFSVRWTSKNIAPSEQVNIYIALKHDKNERVYTSYQVAIVPNNGSTTISLKTSDIPSDITGLPKYYYLGIFFPDYTGQSNNDEIPIEIK